MTGMKSTKTKTFLILMIILDLFFVAVFIALFTFIKKQISDTVSMTDQIKAEIKKEQTLSLMKKDIEDSKNYQDKLYGYFIGKDNVADFLKILENLVSSSSLKSEVQSVAYEPTDKSALISTELVRVKMNVVGEWKNIQFFIQLLENYPLKIDIKNVSLNKSSDAVVSGRQIPQWSANIDFTVAKLKNI
jgi:hypothetical protein